MEGARLFALLLYFEGRVEGRGAIAPLKHDALVLGGGGYMPFITQATASLILLDGTPKAIYRILVLYIEYWCYI